MSAALDLTAEEANEQIILQAGRRAPFTMIGDWVALCVAAKLIDREALALYVVLSMHVNGQRDDNEVWPSRGTLAALLGYKQARAVDKYLDQLEAIRAIDADRADSGKGSSGNRRNRYTVHQTPPEGFSNVVSLADWYKARKAEKAAEEAAAASEGSEETAGQTVVRCSASRGGGSARQRTRGGAPQRTTVVRPSAHEEEEVQEEEEKGGGVDPATPAPAPAVPDAPPPPKADFRDPKTWLCSEHLAAVMADPGVDLPKCPRCPRVADWCKPKHEAWLREQAASQRAEEASGDAALRAEAQRARDCGMCREETAVRPGGVSRTSWMRVIPGTQVPLTPYTVCDHETPHHHVVAELAARDARPGTPAETSPAPVEAQLPAAGHAAARALADAAMARSKARKAAPMAAAVPDPWAAAAADEAGNGGQDAAEQVMQGASA